VLEVGPGPGVFKAVASCFGVCVETLDIDSELRPDYLGSVFNMPFGDGEYDVVCAFQVLEHMPFKKSLEAFQEMARVSDRYILFSVPDSSVSVSFTVGLPHFGVRSVYFSFPRLWDWTARFDGQHYWEIGKRGYSRRRVSLAFQGCAGVCLSKRFRIPEYPYHCFFVFDKTGKKKLIK